MDNSYARHSREEFCEITLGITNRRLDLMEISLKMCSQLAPDISRFPEKGGLKIRLLIQAANFNPKSNFHLMSFSLKHIPDSADGAVLQELHPASP